MSSKQSHKQKQGQFATTVQRYPTPAATASDPDVQSRSDSSSDENGRGSRSKSARQSDASTSNDTWFSTSSSGESSSDEELLTLKHQAGRDQAATQAPPQKASLDSIAALRDLVRHEKLARERIADPDHPDDLNLEAVIQKLKEEYVTKQKATERAYRKRMRKERRLQRARQQQHCEGCKEVNHDSGELVQSYVVSGHGVEARKAAYRKKYKFVSYALKLKLFQPKYEYPVDTETGTRRVKGMGITLKPCPYTYAGEDERGRDIWFVKEDVSKTDAMGVSEQ